MRATMPKGLLQDDRRNNIEKPDILKGENISIN